MGKEGEKFVTCNQMAPITTPPTKKRNKKEKKNLFVTSGSLATSSEELLLESVFKSTLTPSQLPMFTAMYNV